MSIGIYARDEDHVERNFLRNDYSLENIFYEMNIVEKCNRNVTVTVTETFRFLIPTLHDKVPLPIRQEYDWTHCRLSERK